MKMNIRSWNSKFTRINSVLIKVADMNLDIWIIFATMSSTEYPFISYNWSATLIFSIYCETDLPWITSCATDDITTDNLAPSYFRSAFALKTERNFIFYFIKRTIVCAFTRRIGSSGPWTRTYKDSNFLSDSMNDCDADIEVEKNLLDQTEHELNNDPSLMSETYCPSFIVWNLFFSSFWINFHVKKILKF